MMRCHECPALRCEGYEYPEEYCLIGVPDEKLIDFPDGECGCRKTYPVIKREAERIEALRDKSYEGIGEWYVLSHEIEEDPDMLKKCVNAMTHAIGYSEISKIYHRHGKAFYKPARNYYATTRGTDSYPAWKKLHYCKLASCSVPDDEPYWEEPDMEEMLYFTVTREGAQWLSKRIGVTVRI